MVGRRVGVQGAQLGNLMRCPTGGYRRGGHEPWPFRVTRKVRKVGSSTAVLSLPPDTEMTCFVAMGLGSSGRKKASLVAGFGRRRNQGGRRAAPRSCLEGQEGMI